MAKKTVGYVQLEWACPRCATRNPGPQKFCNGCGGPQPADVPFTQAAEEKLLTDAAEIARAKAGPDIHCPYCGSRNPGAAKFCGACGGKLEGGQARQAGQVVGAHRAAPAQPVRCPSCGTENPAGAGRCSNCGAGLAAEAAPAPAVPPQARPPRRGLLIGLGVLLVLGCLATAAVLILGGRTHPVSAVVQDVYWSRSVALESLGMVQYEDWRDNIPADAQVGGCRTEYRATSDEPGPNSTEVCGTPYTVDTGGGYAEVVQDCVYEVYDDWCDYTVQGWQVVDTLTSSGYDLNPYWPSVSLASDQREGEAQEQYTVVFATDDGQVEYQAPSAADFSRFTIGSAWELEIDSFGNLSSISPGP